MHLSEHDVNSLGADDSIGAGAPNLTPAIIDAGVELFREWEIARDFNGGFAANEINVEELVRHILSLVNEFGLILGDEKLAKISG